MRLLKFLVIAWGYILYIVVWKPMVAHAKWDEDSSKGNPSSQTNKIISEERP